MLSIQECKSAIFHEITNAQTEFNIQKYKGTLDTKVNDLCIRIGIEGKAILDSDKHKINQEITTIFDQMQAKNNDLINLNKYKEKVILLAQTWILLKFMFHPNGLKI